ncbi:unnamed protein product [Orchesella dallaii]|uniref:Odorant receptor n=1 Tax=Orchesella dallaii TaxID=48710 RepID=A0ABP1REG9_9HEXA
MPYDWNKKKRLIELSKRGRIMMRLNFVLLLIAVCFCVGNCIRFRISNDYDNLNKTYMWTVAGLAALEALWLVVYYEEDGYSEFNSLLLYLRTMNREYMSTFDPNKSKYSLLFEAGLLLIFFDILLINFLTCSFVIYFPNTPAFVGSILPEATPLPIRLLVAYIYPCYYLAIAGMNFYTYAIITFVYGIIFIPFVLREFRLGRRNYLSYDQLRQPPMIITAYRAVQILQRKSTDLFGQMLVPMQTLMGNIVVSCAYMIIKHRGILKPTTVAMLLGFSTTCGIFWGLILLLGGYINLYAKRILDSWKYHPWPTKQDRKLMRKFRKSCTPLMLNYGKTYIIKRLTVLKFIRGLSNGILRALLTLK